MSFEKHLWILRLSVLFMVRNNQVESILTRGPSDVVAVKGSTVVFSCYTDLSLPVYWDTEKAGDNYDNTWYAIYQGDPSVITNQFETRFNMSIDSSRNQYNLTIHDVQMKDAGTYRCGDNFGRALENYKKGIPNQGATAELTVIGSNLACSQNLSVNYTDGSDALPSEIINCSISYEGRIIPTLRWTTKWTNNDGADQYKHDYIVTQSHPTKYDESSTLKSTSIISSPQRFGKSSLTWAVLTSSGYLTGYDRQSESNSIPYFSSFTPGIALLCGILLGMLSFAFIIGIGLALRLGTIKIWKIKITAEPERDGTSDSNTVALLTKDVPKKPGIPVCTRRTSDSITLVWEYPNGNDEAPAVKKYILERIDSLSNPIAEWKVAPGKITEFTVTNLKNLTDDESYEFRVAGENEAGKGDFSDVSQNMKPPQYTPVQWSAAHGTPEDVSCKLCSNTNILDKVDPVLSITRMKFYSRRWADHRIIGGIEVTYSNGTQLLLGGNDYTDCEIEECVLDYDERILEVIIQSGCMIDGLSFTTNKRETLGPYGGKGGNRNSIVGRIPKSHLAVLRGKIYQTEGKLALRHLQFGWITLAG